MKKIYTLLIGLLTISYVSAQEWNISAADYNALGDVLSTTTVSDLTIFAASDKKVTIDANNKSIDGYDFTHRLKLNGSGSWTDDTTPYGRVLSVNVTGDCTITVYGMSSSSSATRTLIVSSGNETNEVGRFTTGGSAIDKGVFQYSGGASTIYLFSESSGFNVYMIKVEYSTAISDVELLKVELGSEFYGFNGVKLGNNYNSLPKGVYIKRTIFEDGSVSAEKVFKAY